MYEVKTKVKIYVTKCEFKNNSFVIVKFITYHWTNYFNPSLETMQILRQHLKEESSAV